jgi:hypothetical protein
MMKPISLLLVVILLTLFIFDRDVCARIGASLVGRVVASYDGSRGNMKVIMCDSGDCVGSYITDSPSHREYIKLLQKKYGIKYKVICDSTNRPSSSFNHSWKSGYQYGYNTISVSTIEQKLGEEALWKIEMEAEQIYRANHPVK